MISVKKNILILAGIVFSIYFSINACMADADTKNKSNIVFNDALNTAEAMPRLFSILVSYQGNVVLEKYFNGSSPDKLVNIKSASKSFISALVGIAIDKGHINNSKQSIGNYFPGYINSETSQKISNISIEDLLTMQSGLESTSNRNYGAWVLSPDWIGYALNQPSEYLPGTRMQYSTGNTHLLSAILTKVTGMSLLQFARENLTSALGFRLADWPRDPDGIYFGGNDMEMTARQMLAFGALYLNKGQFNGRQVISAEWIDESLLAHTESTREQGRYYGYGWWLKEMASYETAYAWGYGGQYIILVPDLKLVVVTTSSSTPHRDRRSHRRLLTDLIENLIIHEVAQYSKPTAN
ncbi:MAG: serine hydrolase domain-containing protein [Gammaproteobacteria bacterium]|jgi:CubicO group peptidase (beta-lactamase class C family)